MGALETRMESLEKSQAAHFAELSARLEKLEARQFDTKPIWERVLTELTEINSRLDDVDKRIDSLDRRIESLDRRFSILNDDAVHLRAEYRKV